VIVGCHYDSWAFGAVNPNSGTAVLMELSKSFSALQSKGSLDNIVTVSLLFQNLMTLVIRPSYGDLALW